MLHGASIDASGNARAASLCPRSRRSKTPAVFLYSPLVLGVVIIALTMDPVSTRRSPEHCQKDRLPSQRRDGALHPDEEKICRQNLAQNRAGNVAAPSVECVFCPYGPVVLCAAFARRRMTEPQRAGPRWPVTPTCCQLAVPSGASFRARHAFSPCSEFGARPHQSRQSAHSKLDTDARLSNSAGCRRTTLAACGNPRSGK